MSATVAALCARLGWTEDYAEHLMDPRCKCDWGGYDEQWSECGIWLHTKYPDRYDADGKWIGRTIGYGPPMWVTEAAYALAALPSRWAQYDGEKFNFQIQRDLDDGPP